MSNSSPPDATTNNSLSIEESVRLSEQRMQEIEEVIKNSPLTSERRDLSTLRAYYAGGENNDNFLAGISYLEPQYVMRVVRGDGNCYYRAFLWLLCEKLLEQDEKDPESQRILEFCKKESFEKVKQAGYEEMTISVFYDEFVELVEKVVTGSISLEELHKEMNEENATSDYCTWYCRVITATHLRSDPDRFLPFLSQPGMDIVQFCQREVEPMGKEVEQVAVLALAEALGVQVQIEYLDGHPLINGKVTNHEFGPESSPTKLHLLYRPGHYDILYPRAT